MPKFRNEKYIEQRQGKNGWSFRVHYNKHSKTFSEKEYGDPRVAYKKAVSYRNDLLNSDTEIFVPYLKTIYDVLEESFDLLAVRQKTRKNQLSLFNSYIKDRIQVRQFSQAFVYAKLNAMIEKCSDDTISRVYNIFKRIDKTCLINKYYENSVMFSVVCPKSHLNVTNKEKEPVTKDQLEQIKQACSRLRYEHDQKQFPLILDFIYMTGCRPCEVWPLTWNDVTDHISINKELGSSNLESDVIRQPKTPLSNRELPITPKMKTLLKRAKTLSDNELVFPDSFGKMHTTDLVGQKLSNIAKKIGIDFHLYDIRHRFATDLTLANVDDRTKMELMGHKNVQMTLSYARSNDNAKKDALKGR